MYTRLQRNVLLKKEQLLSGCLIILICILSLLRIIYSLQNIKTRADRAHFFEIADSLYKGKGFVIDYIIWPSMHWQTVTHPTGQRHPLFPLILAFSFVLFGESYVIANCVSAFFSIITAILLMRIGRRYGKNIGLLSAFIYLLNPYAFVNSINTYPTTLYGFFLTITLWQFMKITNSRNENNTLKNNLLECAYVGLPAGIAWLTRPEGILLIPTFFLFLLLLRRKDKFQQLFIISLIIILLISPWMIRNYLLFSSPFHGTADSKLWAANYEDFFCLNAKTKDDYFANHDFTDFLKIKASNFLWILLSFGKDSLSYYGLRKSQKYLFFLFISFVGSYWLNKSKEKWFLLLYIYIILFSLVTSMSIVYPLWNAKSYTRYYVALQPLFSIIISVGITKTLLCFKNLYLEHRLTLENKITYPAKANISLTMIIILIGSFSLQSAVHGFKIYDECQWVSTQGGWSENTHIRASNWIKKNSPSDAIIMTRYVALVHHYSYRKTIMIPNENLSEIISFAEKYNASYLILTELIAYRLRQSLIPVWDGSMEETFELCHETSQYRIYFFKINT